MRSTIRLIAINLGVLLAMVLAIEALLGSWTGPAPRETAFTCFDSVLHHRYCGGIVHRNRMAGADGGLWVSTHTDRLGMMVAQGETADSDARNADVILIGDSFMQADEMPWEDRMGQIIARQTGLRVATVGYSSWAPATQTNWLVQSPLRSGVHVAYFLMTNDLTPSYPNSNMRYHAEVPDQQFPLTFEPQRADEPSHAPELAWQDEIVTRSFFLSRLRAVQQGASVPAGTPALQNLLSAQLAAPQSCADASQAGSQLPAETWLLDYIYLSLPAECWPQLMRDGVDEVVDDITLAYQHARSARGTMHVYLIPAGWAFQGENMIGKAVVPQFGLAADATVGQSGIAAHLAVVLGRREIPFTDLEPVISTLKLANPGQFYFPADGHWTGLTHRLLAPIIMSNATVAAR